MNNDSHEASPYKIVLPAIAVIAGMGLFILILSLVYVPERPGTVAPRGFSPEERRTLLEERQEKEAEELGSYGVIDQDEGVVRLPIERAMELTVQELNF
ncbi:MAG: hypothetical protein WD490_03225 [Opitutales bacterium]